MKWLWGEIVDRAIFVSLFLALAVVTVFSPKKGLALAQDFLTDP